MAQWVRSRRLPAAPNLPSACTYVASTSEPSTSTTRLTLPTTTNAFPVPRGRGRPCLPRHTGLASEARTSSARTRTRPGVHAPAGRVPVSRHRKTCPRYEGWSAKSGACQGHSRQLGRCDYRRVGGLRLVGEWSPRLLTTSTKVAVAAALGTADARSGQDARGLRQAESSGALIHADPASGEGSPEAHTEGHRRPSHSIRGGYGQDPAADLNVPPLEYQPLTPVLGFWW